MHLGVRENPGRYDNLDNDNDAEGILLVPTLQRGNAVRPRKLSEAPRDAGASALAPTLERGSQSTTAAPMAFPN